MKLVLYLVYATFLAFVIGYSIFASVTFDGAIKGSYEKGEQYPQDLARLHRLGWQFIPGSEALRAGKTGLLDLLILDRNGSPLTGASVSMEISRPAGPQTLPTQKAAEQQKGHYTASVNLPGYGHWLVNARIALDGPPVEHEFRIFANQ
jgi:nitrogen fixation protein FixH